MKRVLLLDADGVLLDSVAGQRDVWFEVARRLRIPVDAVWPECLGERTRDTALRLRDHADPESILRVHDESVVSIRPRAKAMPGAHDLLRGLDESSWAIVTSGRRRRVVADLRAARLPVPHVLVSAESVEAGKPAPEGYLRAAEALGAAPSDSLVVEDSVRGAAAGTSAGCVVLLLPSGGAGLRGGVASMLLAWAAGRTRTVTS